MVPACAGRLLRLLIPGNLGICIDPRKKVKKMTKRNESDTPALVFEYVNWQGEKGVRHVRPIKIWYGHTEFHKEDQWLLKATDLDKKAERDFAVKDILRFIPDSA